MRDRCCRVTLMLYRKRTARRFRLASTSGVRFRYSRQKEAARGCGGRGELWEFNRFLPEKPCQTRTFAKTLLLIFITKQLRRPAASSYLRGHPFLQADSSEPLCLYTRHRPPRERLRSDGLTEKQFQARKSSSRRSPLISSKRVSRY
jgi:hypothetical protein